MLGSRDCSAYICRNAGFGQLEPRQKTAFSCPVRSEPPLGPVVRTSGKSYRSTYYPATVSHHSLGHDSPATAFPRGNSQPVPRSLSHPISPTASHTESRSSSSVSILPCISHQHTEPWHALLASSSQQAKRCHCSAASATHLYSCFLTILPQEDLLNVMHLKQPLPELVSPPLSPFPLMIILGSRFYALPACQWWREEP